MNNGYATITLNDEVIGLKFAMPANRMWFMNLKVEWLTGTEPNETGYAYLLYYAYQNNCIIKEEAPKLKFADFAEYVDDAIIDKDKHKEFQQAIQIYEASRYTKKYFDDIKEATKKLEDSIVPDVPEKKRKTRKKSLTE